MSLQLGDKVIILPSPAGFEEAASQFEDIKRRMTATEAPENDMLAVHMLKEDCAILRKGESTSLTFYTKVSIRKANRTTVKTEKDFGELVAVFRKDGTNILDPNSPRMKAIVERLDKAVAELYNSDAKLELTQPVNLGEMDTRPNVYSVLLLLNISSEVNGTRRDTPILGGLSFVRVKERLLYVYTYRHYTSKSDIDVLREFTKTWIGDILAAN